MLFCFAVYQVGRPQQSWKDRGTCTVWRCSWFNAVLFPSSWPVIWREPQVSACSCGDASRPWLRLWTLHCLLL